MLEGENGDYVNFVMPKGNIQIVNSKTFMEDNIQGRK